MGTWAIGAFGNDDACDWSYGLEEVDDLSVVEAALDTVLAVGSGYLETPPAVEALAAIEVIARLQGNWGERDPYSETVDRWVERVRLTPTADHARNARRVIERILAENSELKELWEETEDYEAWVASVHELKNRVGIP